MGSSFAVAAASKENVDFSSQIRPIISAKCFACHGPDDKARKAKLRLDIREQATKEREGVFPIKPGDLKNSEMVRRITSTDPEEIMPPPKAGHPLTPPEIELLKKWVQQGAPYASHWAFTKPVR
ncbi:MAG TPA: c-type cytochrome domain-containing protein, partial [Verrucomicrobiae bacterium]|nr:c-type cytochrome domain-containing protein [Verrucomicrobiae bacterium]